MKDSQLQKKKKRLFKKKKLNTKDATQKASVDSSSSKPRRSWLIKLPKLKFRKADKESSSIEVITATKIRTKVNRVKSKTMSSIKDNEHNILLLLAPIILIFILGILYTINENISENVKLKKLSSQSQTKVSAYPVLINSIQPFVSARTAIVMDAGTQTIIFSKNADLRFSMASTAKIMTALVALEHYQMDSILTVKSSGIEGSILGIRRGEKFYFEDLLYAMLLPSANDAAVAIVDNYPGGKKEFVKKMNEKAVEYNLSNTLFSEPTGLDDDGNFTTVVDLARLASVAVSKQDFAKIISTQQKVITNQNKTKQYVLGNLNRLLGTNGVNGVKTGTTEGAGEVLVTSAIQHGRLFIIVVMNSQDRFSDTSGLLNFISENIKFVSPIYND
jgi:serine-type D-Ala-D-Ala carboxypeptidase (penicillin-binding protein 5/6)